MIVFFRRNLIAFIMSTLLFVEYAILGSAHLPQFGITVSIMGILSLCGMALFMYYTLAYGALIYKEKHHYG